ncbi:hypothetical protein ANO11243_091490 [Dothideomycetidae sp. 11243]|nr:hypothetical protein ANO11243_091490 [fungal sp. No.11243]
MDNIPTSEGTIPLHVPSAHTPCSTFYKAFGDLSCGKPPVVCLHGGPGSTSSFLEELSILWPRYGIPVIIYDQIGCGRSTNLDDEKGGDESFWTTKLFITELESVLDHFKLRGEGPRYDILGLSFGAVFGSEFAATRPKGLRRLILGSPLASIELQMKAQGIRISELPLHAQAPLREAAETQNTQTEAFQEAFTLYNQHCILRLDPMPQAFTDFVKQLMKPSAKKSVQHTMWGLCPLITPKTAGSLRDWTVTPAAQNINVPTLLFNGEFDQSHDIVVQPLFELIPRVRWVTIPGASHCPSLEGERSREKYFSLVGDFLSQPENGEKIEV